MFLLCIFCLPFVLVFCFASFVFFVFFDFGKPNKNIFKKTWKLKKNSKNEKCRKRDTLTRAVSTIVFTNSVFFLFCVSLNFACFVENTIKIGVSAKKAKNNKFYKLKTGPSIS